MLKVCEAVSVYELVRLKDSSIPRVCDSLLSLSDGFVQYCKLSFHPRSWKWRFSICSDGWVYSGVSMDRSLFMSLLMDTLVDALSWRFNSAALEIRVQLSSSIMLFSGYKARSGLVRSGSKSMFSVVRNVHTGFPCGRPHTFPSLPTV